MSEFECRNGHLMSCTWGNTCKICGASLYRMDGKTNRQLRGEEEEFDREREEAQEEEDEEECGQCDQPMSEHDDGECPKKYRED